jgi:hypothetical protein
MTWSGPFYVITESLYLLSLSPHSSPCNAAPALGGHRSALLPWFWAF